MVLLAGLDQGEERPRPSTRPEKNAERRQVRRGHIVKRSKDSYSVVVSLGKDANTGKYKSQWVSIRGTKKEAERRLAEILHQMDTGTYMKPSKTTLGEYLEKWLSDYVWPNLAPRTAEGYESIVRCHLKPSLGKIPLTQLRPEHLQRYYSEKLSEGRCDGKGALSRTTVSWTCPQSAYHLQC